ncbi:MAG: hypothetical protein AAF401_00715 [Pseudomonadota bacterium]
MRDEEFFVGYLPVPGRLSQFLIAISVGLITAFAALAWAAGATQDDPGDGRFRGDFGRQTVKGVLELKPYPLLRVTEGSERIPEGHTLMLSAGGKRGLMGRAASLGGQIVQVSGVMLKRGELDMLQVRGGKNGLQAAEGEGAATPAEPLGKWRLAGEICDGKCLAGAMRPGRRMAHKACANLCLIGGVPPVFLSTQPVEGAETMLIAGPDGGEMPKALYDHVAAFVSIEGELERRGDLLIFKVDPSSVKEL